MTRTHKVECREDEVTTYYTAHFPASSGLLLFGLSLFFSPSGGPILGNSEEGFMFCGVDSWKHFLRSFCYFVHFCRLNVVRGIAVIALLGPRLDIRVLC